MISRFVAALVLFTTLAHAGEFDRLEGEALSRATQSETAQKRSSLTFTELDALPPALADMRAAFFVVKTSAGNYARVLASPALRKPAGTDGAAAPVLVLERYDTFEPGGSGSRVVRGAGLVLFDGFQLDLDGGLVVPSGQGGDLEFVKQGAAGGVLKTVGGALLFTFSKPLPRATTTTGPSPGKAVLPGDFAGRWTLSADGRWSGLMELIVDDERQITGRFRSEANGTTYPVTGEVTPESPQKALFKVKFPRTTQEYAAYLFTEGKNELAGSFVMDERTYGFHAVREGAKAAGVP